MTMPESFNLDNLPTPIGTALLVTDADGLLRALDWEDYDPRMRQLLRLQYGPVKLKDARSPRELRAALTGYFKGDLDRLAGIQWRVAGTPFQQKIWHALPTIPAGTTLSYGALAAKLDVPRSANNLRATRSVTSTIWMPCGFAPPTDCSICERLGPDVGILEHPASKATPRTHPTNNDLLDESRMYCKIEYEFTANCRMLSAGMARLAKNI